MIITEYWPIGVFSMSLTKYVKFGPVWTLHVDVSIK